MSWEVGGGGGGRDKRTSWSDLVGVRQKENNYTNNTSTSKLPVNTVNNRLVFGQLKHFFGKGRHKDLLSK